MDLWPIAAAVLVVNLPFGYWRANVGRYSAQWFLAVHLPVVLVIAFRLFTGLGWQLATIPLLLTSFFVGQLLGNKVHQWWGMWARPPLTSCLVMDVMRAFGTAGRLNQK